MGFYYSSYFNNRFGQIQIGFLNNPIDHEDEIRGYILKEDVLKCYGRLIRPDDIDDQSTISVYLWISYDVDSKPFKITELPIQ